jgi:hypothetical protein
MKILFAAALVAATVASFGAASAMPLAPAPTAANPDVIQVAGGCGRGFHRGPYGGCRPNGGEVVIVERPAPVVVVRPGRVCPPGFAWRYGRCRPF